MCIVTSRDAGSAPWERHEWTLAQDPPAESKQKNTCRSYGALAEHAARVTINMALLTPNGDFRMGATNPPWCERWFLSS